MAKKRQSLDDVINRFRDELAGQARWDAAVFDEATYAEPTAESFQRYQQDLDDAVCVPRTGDMSLLLNPETSQQWETVPIRTARLYSGKTDRHIRRLIHGVPDEAGRVQKLRATGRKGSRQVLVEDLLRFFPPQK